MDDDQKRQFSEEATTIITSRVEFIERNYPKIRDALSESYDWPEIDPLRHEICLCIFFGLHQGAITLTNHFLESLLKYGLIIYDSKQKRKGGGASKTETKGLKSLMQDFEEARMRYFKAYLGNNIDQACSKGLITKQQKKQLHIFRDVFRNAFSHSDKDKTFGDAEIPVQGFQFTDSGFSAEQPTNVRMSKFIIGQGLFQAGQAEREAPRYFLYMHSLAKQIRAKLFGAHRKP